MHLWVWFLIVYFGCGILYAIYHGIWLFVYRRELGDGVKTIKWMTRVLLYDVFLWWVAIPLTILFSGWSPM